MVDFNKMLGSLNNSGISKGLLGGLAGGAVAGGLMSKGGRKTAKKVLTYGGIAAVGGLAWQAYKSYQANQTPAQGQPEQPMQPTQSTQHIPIPPAAGALQYQQQMQEQEFGNLTNNDNSQSLFIVKTMVAAAMADGHLDGSEYQKIINKASEFGLDADEQRIIFDEIKQPMPIDLIVAQTNSPVLAVEVYTASVLAIDETQPKAEAYLRELSSKLNIPPPLVTSVHHQLATIA